MNVLKFGGSLLDGIEGVRNVVEEIERSADSLLVVVSAFADVTNRLERLAAAAIDDPARAREDLAGLLTHHRAIGEAVATGEHHERLSGEIDAYETRLDNLIEGLSITGELSSRTLDLIVHFGELFSSAILSAALEVERIPATDLLITDNVHRYASVNLEESRRRVTSRLAERFTEATSDSPVMIVTEGYIARGAGGEITTMGRESSDYSATLFGRFLGAEEVRIYAGVPGIMSADPALCQEARTIEGMSYAMAREIARLGAKVIHPRTVRPAEEEGIRLVLRDLAGNATVISREPGSGARSFPLVRRLLHLRVFLHRTNDGDDDLLRFLRGRGALIRALRVGRELDLVIDAPQNSLVEDLRARFSGQFARVEADHLHLLSIVQDWPVALEDAALFLQTLGAGTVRTFWGDPDERSVSALVDVDDPGPLLGALHRQFLTS